MIPKTELVKLPARPATPGAAFRRPRVLVPALLLLVITVACYAAPWIAPYPPNQQDLTAVAQPPSGAHWLGTDTLGRDVLSRLLYGGQESLSGVTQAVIMLLMVGVVLGLIAGYFGGMVDRFISRMIEIVQSLPFIIVVFAALSLFGRSMLVAMIVFGLLGSMGLARVVRGATLTVRNELFVAAAKVSGVSEGRVLARHVVPRILSTIIVQLSLFAAIALGVQTGLAFLGLGVVPPQASWGGMVADATLVIATSPWLLLPAGITIAVCVLAFGLVGDGVRDATSSSRTRGAGTVAAALSNWRAPANSLGKKSFPQTPPGGANENALVVEDLVVEIQTDANTVNTVVRGISFTVRRGQVLGLVGESGSGKTITALAILRLLPSGGRIAGGSIRLDNDELTTLGRRDMDRIYGRRVAMVSQEPMASLDPAFTVGQQLRELIRSNTPRVSTRAASARAIELLTQVQLPHPEEILRRYPHELSGGMAQRVVIAMALSGNPELLIADEPTTALDVTVQAEILDLLRSIQAERSMSVLLVTHDLGVVADLCTDVVVMRGGEIVERNDTLSLFDHPTHAYTRGLIEATPSLARPLSQTPSTKGVGE